METRNLEYEITIKHNGEVLVDTKTDCIIGAINEDDGIIYLTLIEGVDFSSISNDDTIKKHIEEIQKKIQDYNSHITIRKLISTLIEESSENV